MIRHKLIHKTLLTVGAVLLTVAGFFWYQASDGAHALAQQQPPPSPKLALASLPEAIELQFQTRAAAAIDRWQYQNDCVPLSDGDIFCPEPGAWTDIPGSAGQPSGVHVVTGLTGGSSYAYRVRVLTDAGDFTSDAVAARAGQAPQPSPTPEPTATPEPSPTPESPSGTDEAGIAAVPSAPTNVTAQGLDGAVRLHWAQVSDASSGYEYQQQDADGTTWPSDWTPAGAAASTTTWHDVGSLTNGTSYAFRVRAVNNDGGGAASAAVTAIPHKPIVSNLGETTASRTAPDGEYASSFITGSQSGGYSLKSVSVRLASSNVTITSVKIFNNASAAPDSALSGGTLVGPGSITGNSEANHVYTSAAGVSLSASTRYWIVVDHESSFQTNVYNTSSGNETNTPSSAGWVIEHGTKRRTTGSWTDDQTNRSGVISVYVAGTAPNAPTGVAALALDGAVRLHWTPPSSGATPTGYQVRQRRLQPLDYRRRGRLARRKEPDQRDGVHLPGAGLERRRGRRHRQHGADRHAGGSHHQQPEPRRRLRHYTHRRIRRVVHHRQQQRRLHPQSGVAQVRGRDRHLSVNDNLGQYIQ